jgi:threonine dehydratase
VSGQQPPPSATAPGIEAIQAARATIKGVARLTPVVESRHLGDAINASVLLKAENLQRTGSFKIRGGYNRIAALSDAQRERGVVAASAGNHAQGVALAAQMLGVPATIYMPVDASMAKVEATRGYGATIEFVGVTFDDAQQAARDHAQREGSTFVSAFDDELIIAGQGTLAVELIDQVGEFDVVVVPCGGGGLLGGMALALKTLAPATRVIGVQAAGCAAMVRSIEHGAIEAAVRAQTIADGIAVKQPGELTFPLVARYVDEMVTVTDEEIVETISLLLERHKLLVEGAGAAGAAVLHGGELRGLAGKRVVVVLSGGNIDLPLLQSVIRRGLTVSGRYLVLRTHILDRPGSLLTLLGVVAEARANIIDVVHHREGMDIFVTDTEVQLTVETRDARHARDVMARLTRHGYAIERVT